MKTLQMRTIVSFVSLTATGLLLLATGQAQANDVREPDVPMAIQVLDGNWVHFHTLAEGVQIYTWSGSAWVFRAPEATLYDMDGNIVGIHYAGPTWESASGSKVVGARISGAPSPNPDSVPLLLLGAVTTEGPGIFARTTYIQRVNTVGGIAPASPGSMVGEEARVPYTAEYFFYRQD